MSEATMQENFSTRVLHLFDGDKYYPYNSPKRIQLYKDIVLLLEQIDQEARENEATIHTNFAETASSIEHYLSHGRDRIASLRLPSKGSKS